MSETKTSSRLTCRVVKRASGRSWRSSSSSKAGDRAMRLGDGQGIAVILDPGRQHRLEP